MRVTPLLLSALLLAGCMGGPGGPAAPPTEPDEPEDATPDAPLAFGAPVTVIASCGLDLRICFEPSVAATTTGTLVVNSYIAPFARSTDGDQFLYVPGPNGAAVLGSGGDALLQADASGAMWWSVLEASSLRVAKTTDAGLTWDLDVTVPLPSRPDRQWLTFSTDRVLLTYQGEAGVNAASSSDGGQTWSGPVAIEPSAHIHGLGTWCQDRFAVPLFHDDGTLKLAISPDSEVWELRDVPNATGDFFPAVSCTPGGLRVAWRAFDDTLRAADSPDLGASWMPQVQFSLPGEHLPVSPLLVQHGAATWVAYFTAAGNGTPADLHVLRLEAGQVSRGLAVAQLQTTRDNRPGNTDFPWFVVKDGRPLVVYADGTTIKLVSGE